MERCPSCDREFKSVLDYPLVQVEGVDILEVSHPKVEEIFNTNVTRIKPMEVISAVESESIGNFLQGLVRMEGKILKPSQINPEFEKDSEHDSYFAVPKHPRIVVTLRQIEDQPVEVRIGVISFMDRTLSRHATMRGITIAKLKLNGLLIGSEVTPV